jgi:DNA-binding MarR family transcriptional regulator
VDRNADIEQLYQDVVLLSRQSRELADELHPGLSLVAYNLLSFVQGRAHVRAADVATFYGLDKSTVSRQVDQLVTADLLRRGAERPGRRGQILEMTDAGNAALAGAAVSLHAYLVRRLSDWPDRDVAAFAQLLDRFNRSTRS